MTKEERLAEVEAAVFSYHQLGAQASLWLITELKASWERERTLRATLECTECLITIERTGNRFCSSQCKDRWWNEEKRKAREFLASVEEMGK